jgi:hypothetical protein
MTQSLGSQMNNFPNVGEMLEKDFSSTTGEQRLKTYYKDMVLASLDPMFMIWRLNEQFCYIFHLSFLLHSLQYVTLIHR